MKTIRLSTVSGSFAEQAADLATDIIVLTEGKKLVAAIVPLKGVDRESIQLSGHPEFLKLIARSRAQFRRRQTISLADMKAALSKKRSPNTRWSRRRRARARAAAQR